MVDQLKKKFNEFSKKSKKLTGEYKKIRDGYQIKVRNTKEATKLIVEHQDLFMDYEVVKGGMDDVFLAVTGKKLGGEH